MVTQSANWINSRKKAGCRHILVRLGWGMFSYIKNQWLSISLKKKLGAFSVVVILVMGLSIAFNMLVMNFSLESFNVILNDNSLCYDVQESMEQEADAFELYVRERSGRMQSNTGWPVLRRRAVWRPCPLTMMSLGLSGMPGRGILRTGYEGYPGFSGTRSFTWTVGGTDLWSGCTGIWNAGVSADVCQKTDAVYPEGGKAQLPGKGSSPL